jgi:hypothetical protein
LWIADFKRVLMSLQRAFEVERYVRPSQRRVNGVFSGRIILAGVQDRYRVFGIYSGRSLLIPLDKSATRGHEKATEVGG